MSVGLETKSLQKLYGSGGMDLPPYNWFSLHTAARSYDFGVREGDAAETVRPISVSFSMSISISFSISIPVPDFYFGERTPLPNSGHPLGAHPATSRPGGGERQGRRPRHSRREPQRALARAAAVAGVDALCRVKWGVDRAWIGC